MAEGLKAGCTKAQENPIVQGDVVTSIHSPIDGNFFTKSNFSGLVHHAFLELVTPTNLEAESVIF